MPVKKESVLAFALVGIETMQFAILNEVVEAEKLAFTASFSFGMDAKQNAVACVFKYQLFSGEIAALVIETSVNFAVSEDDFELTIAQKGECVLPKNFAIHLAVITVGTARGILHEKTRHSPLHIYPIPSIDVASEITEAVTIGE